MPEDLEANDTSGKCCICRPFAWTACVRLFLLQRV